MWSCWRTRAGGPRTAPEALTRRTYALFGQYQELVGNLSDQLVASVLDIRDPGLLADTIAANINLRHQDRQRVLQELHPAPAAAGDERNSGA